MKTDQELLREFVRTHSESAFTELVQRHIGLVYGAACRETKGNEAQARDVAQLVFIELASKAATLQKHPTVIGWLYTSVRFVSANVRRAEQRRTQREQEVLAMNELLHSNATDPAWEELKPVLDDAMHELNETDRTAVLLRYFEGKNLREVGESLSLSENTARMRVDRALDKLQKLLAKRGVHSTSTALAKTLSVGTLVAASPALIATVTGSALAASALPAASTATLFGIITMAKLKWIGIGVLAITTTGVVTWEEHQRRDAMQENRSLREQLEETAQLREENERLLAAVGAAEELRQSEIRELLQYRAQADGKPGFQPTSTNKKTGAANAWKERFDATYHLPGGEIVRRVGKPFIPEREEFYRQMFPTSDQPKEAPDYLVFREDENGKRVGRPNSGYTGGKPTVDHVLRHVLGLGRDKYLGPDELLKLQVQGDWILRDGASMESKLAALEPILLDATGRNIRFERQRTEEDVVVVRGQFTPEQGQNIDIFSENKNSAGSGTGTFDRFLDRLGDRLNISFVNEASVPISVPMQWNYHTDARFDRDGSGVPLTVLENLSRQTGLQFGFQRRPTEIWMVKE